MNGFGLAGFMNGLSTGVNTGLKLGAAVKKGQENSMLSDASDEATAAREAAATGIMDKSATTTLQPGTNNPATKWTIDGQQYTDAAAAKEAAGKQAGDPMEFYAKVAIPKMKDFYLKRGDMEKADAWEKWADDKEQKKAFKEWNEGYNAFQTGDVGGIKNYVKKLYASYPDGYDVVGEKEVKGSDGNVTGYNFTLKNQKTGETVDHLADSSSLLEYGKMALARGNPQARFELDYRDTKEAERLAIRQQFDTKRDDLKFNRQLAMEGIKQQGGIDLARARSTFKTNEEVKAFDRNVQRMRDADMSDDEIRQAIPSLLGVSGTDSPYKKPMSQEERAYALHESLMTNDPKYRRMTPEEQDATILATMNRMNRVSSGGKKTGGQTEPGAQQGIPVYDEATGKIIYVNK